MREVRPNRLTSRGPSPCADCVSPPSLRPWRAHAACAAMDPGVERIRCRVQARVWYRDLTQMKKAINYAKYGS